MANQILSQDKALAKRTIVKQSALIRVEGKRFFCKCGANVFHEFSDGSLGCNACDRVYEEYE
jgi:hypothetical protein